MINSAPAVKFAQHRARLVSVCLGFGAFVLIYTEIVIQWNLRATRHEQSITPPRDLPPSQLPFQVRLSLEVEV